MNGWMFSLLGMVVVFVLGLFFVQSGRADNSHYYGRDEGDFGRRGGEGGEGYYGSSDGGGDGGGGGGD
jgi:hypothetical protein